MISRSRLESDFWRLRRAAREQRGVQARVDVGAALGDGRQRVAQLARRALLERVAARAGVQAPDQQVDLVGAGVEHDAALGVGVDQLRGQLDPDSSPSRMSISATSGSSRSTSSRPSAAVPGRAQHLDAVASEQQLEPFAEGLVIFDRAQGEGHVMAGVPATGGTCGISGAC